MKSDKFKKFLGVDWGEKRIGLSLADEEVKLATPWKIVTSLDDLIQEIQAEKIDVVILGEPLKIHSNTVAVAQEFQDFFHKLKEKTKAEVITLDERLSSKAVRSLQASANHSQKSRKKKSQEKIDAIAAMLILQQYLDSCL